MIPAGMVERGERKRTVREAKVRAAGEDGKITIRRLGATSN